MAAQAGDNLHIAAVTLAEVWRGVLIAAIAEENACTAAPNDACTVATICGCSCRALASTKPTSHREAVPWFNALRIRACTCSSRIPGTSALRRSANGTVVWRIAGFTSESAWIQCAVWWA